MAPSSSQDPANARTIDHIVHLTPPGTVDEVSKQFTDLGFQVRPGGTHADGLTANALIVLKEGTYIELISFTHPISHYPPSSPERKARETHRWAKREPGWIDVAFLGNGVLKPGDPAGAERISDVINQRAQHDGSGVRYLEEVEGGRIRPDGVRLKWVISAPAPAPPIPGDGGGEPSLLPFFCGDMTPRGLRVQTEPPSNTEHPSTVQGLAFVRILVRSAGIFDDTIKQFTTVLGSKPSFVSKEIAKADWELDAALGAENELKPRLIVEVVRAEDKEETEFLKETEEGIGLYEVGLFVQQLGRYPERTRSPYGRIRLVLKGYPVGPE